MGTPLRPYKKKIRLSDPAGGMQAYLSRCGLNTVCESARCPNRQECYGKGIATFMILGDICTRGCRFCGVGKGRPGPVDAEEPERVAYAVKEKGLGHAVITSVTRDDLPDGGSGHFATVLRKVRKLNPDTTTEVLIPDFKGSFQALQTVLEADPDVLNHNVETVPDLYPSVRPQADFRQSLDVLKRSATLREGVLTKSGLMVGLGETRDAVVAVLERLRDAACDIVTIGQYFQPEKGCLPVARMVPDDEFSFYEHTGLEMGFKAVAAGRFVRSSYQAGDIFRQVKEKTF